MAGENSGGVPLTGPVNMSRRTNLAADAVQAHRDDVAQNLNQVNGQYVQPQPQPQPQPQHQQHTQPQYMPQQPQPQPQYAQPHPQYTPQAPQYAQPQPQPQYVPQAPQYVPQAPQYVPPAPQYAPPYYQQQHFAPQPQYIPPMPDTGMPGMPPMPGATGGYDVNNDVEYQAIRRELEVERRRREVLEKEQTELSAMKEEMKNLRQQQEIDKLLNFNADDVDLTNPTELRNKVLAPLVNNITQQYQQPLSAMQQEISKLTGQLAQQKNTSLEMREAELKEVSNQIIFAQHPDFFTVKNSQAWAQLMQTRSPKGNTYNELVVDEYRKGNGHYVNQIINYLKGVQPNVNMMATVSPVMTAVAPPVTPQDQPGDVMTHEQLALLRQEARASGDRAGFRKAMTEHREAKRRASQPLH